MAYDMIIGVAVFLAVSIIFAELSSKLKVTRVVGQMIAGILLGLPAIKALVSEEGVGVLSVLSELGIVFLLFLIGLELNLKRAKKTRKEAVLVSFFAAIVPAVLGYIVMHAFLGFSQMVSLVTAMALAMTAESVVVAVLDELRKLNTRIGQIIVEAGVLDGLFGFVFISSIVLLALDTTNTAFYMFGAKILAFVAAVFLLFKGIIPWITKHLVHNNNRVEVFSIIMGMGFLVAALSSLLDLGPIIGAFLAGIIINLTNKDRKAERIIVEELKVITFGFIVPFFFIYVGFNLDLAGIVRSPSLFFIITSVAIVGKVLGTMLAGFFSTLSLKKLSLIGWGMNARGAIELVIVEIARSAGLITTEIYSAIVGMAIVTTVIFPFIFRAYLKQDKKAMD